MSQNFEWTLGSVWETIAEILPDAPAQTQADRTFTWSQFDTRANGIARTLLDPKASKDDRVALYLRNGPEYLEATAATFKLGIPSINSNYRYRDEELRYLWDDADVSAVVFHGSFTETVAALRDRVPKVRHWIHVDDGTDPAPDWALPYEVAAAASTDRVRSPWGAHGDDLFMLYTGGTTGMPKGVMYRAIDMLEQTNDVAVMKYDLDRAPESIREQISGPGQAHISGSPYMHGSGMFGAWMAMHGGGHIISMTGTGFDAVEFLDALDRYGVSSVTISGEVFARRIIDTLDGSPGRWDSSTVTNVLNSGGMLGQDSKRRLLDHWPKAAILDGFSSSEAFGLGWAVATKDSIPQTGRFTPGPNVWILDPDGNTVVPGSGVIGKVVVHGRLPIGYYKDLEKSEKTFKVVNGVRISEPGDNAILNEDGTIQLMGRDSLCITSGGEKIFTEEVEIAILDHPAVRDVLVVGLPDPQWSQTVAAVVSRNDGADVSAADLIGHVKDRLAGYKAPRTIAFVDVVPRGPNGKADYPAAKALAEAARQPVS